MMWREHMFTFADGCVRIIRIKGEKFLNNYECQWRSGGFHE